MAAGSTVNAGTPGSGDLPGATGASTSGTVGATGVATAVYPA